MLCQLDDVAAGFEDFLCPDANENEDTTEALDVKGMVQPITSATEQSEQVDDVEDYETPAPTPSQGAMDAAHLSGQFAGTH
ncbi:hypothetical protein MTO96_018849 [Rhipicephalus appendiculatus]